MRAKKSTEKTETVQVGSHVQVELVYEAGVDLLEFDIVPDVQADFAHGFLGEGTPLAQAILGRFVGEAIQYQVGDARLVRILAVSPGKKGKAEQVASRRQERMRKALQQAERTNAIIFASSYSGKWGDYDPGGIESWDAEERQRDRDENEAENQ